MVRFLSLHLYASTLAVPRRLWKTLHMHPARSRQWNGAFAGRRLGWTIYTDVE